MIANVRRRSMAAAISSVCVVLFDSSGTAALITKKPARQPAERALATALKLKLTSGLAQRFCVARTDVPSRTIATGPGLFLWVPPGQFGAPQKAIVPARRVLNAH